MTSMQKARLCNQWLVYCLSIGWKRSDLDALQDIFMKHKGWETFKGYTPQAVQP